MNVIPVWMSVDISTNDLRCVIHWDMFHFLVIAPVNHVEMDQTLNKRAHRLSQMAWFDEHLLIWNVASFFRTRAEAGAADNCWTSNGGGQCIHGRCVSSEDGTTFSCQCDPGYSGQFCTDSKFFFFLIIIISFFCHLYLICVSSYMSCSMINKFSIV